MLFLFFNFKNCFALKFSKNKRAKNNRAKIKAQGFYLIFELTFLSGVLSQSNWRVWLG